MQKKCYVSEEAKLLTWKQEAQKFSWERVSEMGKEFHIVAQKDKQYSDNHKIN